MRVTQQELEAHHASIVAKASRRLRERGIRGTSVAEAMKDAGMTHGGFYRHFRDKNALVCEAMQAAFDQCIAPVEEALESDRPEAVIAAFKARYLSQRHVDNPGVGCPLPSLGSESAREPEDVKAEFAAGLGRVINAMSAASKGKTAQAKQADALREMATMVGAILLARACGEPMASEILQACRD